MAHRLVVPVPSMSERVLRHWARHQATNIEFPRRIPKERRIPHVLKDSKSTMIIVDSNGRLRQWYASYKFMGYGYIPWRTAT